MASEKRDAVTRLDDGAYVYRAISNQMSTDGSFESFVALIPPGFCSNGRRSRLDAVAVTFDFDVAVNDRCIWRSRSDREVDHDAAQPGNSRLQSRL